MKILKVCLCAAWILGACGNHTDENAAPQQGASTSAPPNGQPSPPESPPVVQAPAGPVVTDTGFELRATTEASYQAGQQGRFGIALTPRGIYHVNQEYPIRVTLRAPNGVTLAKTELARADAAEFGERLARFDIPFTSAQAGSANVQAEVDFAVCTPENCMPDRRTVSFTLAVQ